MPGVVQNTGSLIARAKRLVDDADKWRDAAEKVLYWASCSVKTPKASPFNDKALSLVHRCFKVKDHVFDFQVEKDISNIKKVISNVGKFFESVKAGNGFLTLGPAKDPGDIAYAVVGGWKSGNKDGLTFVAEKCNSKSDESLTDVIMHESVHFAGGIGHAKIGNDVAYGEKAFLLSNEKALKNASSYAYLAYLARMDHTKWLTAT
ncbi:MAG: hypothetical protein R3C59_09040 [Planctomycetaceae bacterium]